MWELLENKRFENLKQSAVNLQGDLIYNKRCPKCTLIPPCKHYESQEDIVNEAGKYLHTKNFKTYLSPKKLQGLNKAEIEEHLISRIRAVRRGLLGQAEERRVRRK